MIRHAELLTDFDQFLKLVWTILLWTTDLHGDCHSVAKCIGVFHLPVSVFDVLTPADHTVILHQDGLVLFGKLGNFTGVLWRTWSLVASETDFTEEHFWFRD